MGGACSASKLRKKGEAVYDAKYAGQKSSRNAIFDAESGSDGDGSDEDMGDFEDLEGGDEDSQDGSGDDSQDESGSDEDEDAEDEVEEEVAPAPKPKKSSKSAGKERATTTEQDEKAMMSQLKQAASADVEKGRDVKKQLVRAFPLRERHSH